VPWISNGSPAFPSFCAVVCAFVTLPNVMVDKRAPAAKAHNHFVGRKHRYMIAGWVKVAMISLYVANYYTNK